MDVAFALRKQIDQIGDTAIYIVAPWLPDSVKRQIFTNVALRDCELGSDFRPAIQEVVQAACEELGISGPNQIWGDLPVLVPLAEGSPDKLKAIAIKYLESLAAVRGNGSAQFLVLVHALIDCKLVGNADEFSASLDLIVKKLNCYDDRYLTSYEGATYDWRNGAVLFDELACLVTDRQIRSFSELGEFDPETKWPWIADRYKME